VTGIQSHDSPVNFLTGLPFFAAVGRPISFDSNRVNGNRIATSCTDLTMTTHLTSIQPATPGSDPFRGGVQRPSGRALEGDFESLLNSDLASMTSRPGNIHTKTASTTTTETTLAAAPAATTVAAATPAAAMPVSSVASALSAPSQSASSTQPAKSVTVAPAPVYGLPDSAGNPEVVAQTQAYTLPSPNGLTWDQYWQQIENLDIPSVENTSSTNPADVATRTDIWETAENAYVTDPLSGHNLTPDQLAQYQATTPAG